GAVLERTYVMAGVAIASDPEITGRPADAEHAAQFGDVDPATVRRLPTPLPLEHELTRSFVTSVWLQGIRRTCRVKHVAGLSRSPVKEVSEPFRKESTWTGPLYGNRAFLLFRDRQTNDLKGIVFHRPSSGGPQVASMCHWCQRVRRRGEV